MNDSIKQRSCRNPEHLFRGSQTDNMRDMVEKGRSARGTSIRTNVLEPSQVLAIYEDGRRQKDIASQYGISQSLVSRIKSGKDWAWLTGHQRS